MLFNSLQANIIAKNVSIEKFTLEKYAGEIEAKMDLGDVHSIQVLEMEMQNRKLRKFPLFFLSIYTKGDAIEKACQDGTSEYAGMVFRKYYNCFVPVAARPHCIEIVR